MQEAKFRLFQVSVIAITFLLVIVLFSGLWPPGCKVGRTARIKMNGDQNYVYPNADTQVLFAVEEWNHLPSDVEFFDNGFRILTAGKYRLTGSIVITQIGGTRRVDVFIRRNGSTSALDNDKNRIYAPGAYVYDSFFNLIGKVSRLFDATIDDVFQVIVNHNESSHWRTVGGGADETYMEIACVGR